VSNLDGAGPEGTARFNIDRMMDEILQMRRHGSPQWVREACPELPDPRHDATARNRVRILVRDFDTWLGMDDGKRRYVKRALLAFLPRTIFGHGKMLPVELEDELSEVVFRARNFFRSETVLEHFGITMVMATADIWDYLGYDVPPPAYYDGPVEVADHMMLDGVGVED